jgi:hypothetical protein
MMPYFTTIFYNHILQNRILTMMIVTFCYFLAMAQPWMLIAFGYDGLSERHSDQNFFDIGRQ